MPSLVDVLIEKGIITKERLYQVLQEYRGSGKSFEEIIVDSGLIDEDKLLQFVRMVTPYRPLGLDKIEVDQELLKMIPAEIAEKHSFFPVAKFGGFISIAMADPLRTDVIEVVTKLTKMKPIPFIAKPSQIHAAIKRFYHGEDTVEIGEIDGFSSIIIHEGNKFAVSIAREIVAGKRKGTVVFYGPPGVGKTALLRAIFKEIQKTGRLRGVYHNPATFMALFRDAQAEGNLRYITDMLSSLDVFLFDDLEHLDKDSDECKALIYIAESIVDEGGCVAVTLMRAVEEVTISIDTKMKNLIEGALLVPLTSPGDMTKLKILKETARLEGVEISDNVLEFIVENSGTNLRKLKGAIVQLKALEKYSGKRIPDEKAKSILRRYLG